MHGTASLGLTGVIGPSPTTGRFTNLPDALDLTDLFETAIDRNTGKPVPFRGARGTAKIGDRIKHTPLVMVQNKEDISDLALASCVEETRHALINEIAYKVAHRTAGATRPIDFTTGPCRITVGNIDHDVHDNLAVAYAHCDHHGPILQRYNAQVRAAHVMPLQVTQIIALSYWWPLDTLFPALVTHFDHYGTSREFADVWEAEHTMLALGATAENTLRSLQVHSARLPHNHWMPR